MQLIYNIEHLNRHQADFTIPITEVVKQVKAFLITFEGKREGRFAEVLFKDQSFGYAGVDQTPNRSQVFWGYRDNTERPSPMLLVDERPTVNGLVVIGNWQKNGNFKLATFYPGNVVNPTEPTSKWLWLPHNADLLQESIGFWTTHAFLIDVRQTSFTPVHNFDLDQVLLAGNAQRAQEVLAIVCTKENMRVFLEAYGCDLPLFDECKFSDQEIEVYWEEGGDGDTGAFYVTAVDENQIIIETSGCCNGSYAPNLGYTHALTGQPQGSWYPLFQITVQIPFTEARTKVIQFIIALYRKKLSSLWRQYRFDRSGNGPEWFLWYDEKIRTELSEFLKLLD